MIKIYQNAAPDGEILNREINDYPREYEETVREILASVREGGDAAVLAYGEKFDRVRPPCLEVSKEEIAEAISRIPADFLETLRIAKENIAYFHTAQKRQGFELKKEGGIVLGQKFEPIARVGIYVPGGTASYPSTVLMNAIPAKIAGVGEIVMVTPPSKDGRIRDEILAAAHLAGVDRIFKCGGAQAIGALAYGTESIPRVDKIVGPGNIFVAIAKRMVFGIVGIDMIAGPSEILVVADGASEPRFVAADILSQAEHDRLASAVLVTDSRSLAEAVQAELEKQLSLLPREDIARASIEANGKIIVVGSIDEAILISNRIAPEHLELCLDDPFAYLDKVKNAGSIFLGRYTPESLGDYLAGPNHTLPTSGSARFSSPLSVDDFVKKSSYLYYPRESLGEIKDRVADFAEREGLSAHARAATIRYTDES